jgi:acyl-coenzyme A synthetase/AMP-(fatty) acid ligase
VDLTEVEHMLAALPEVAGAVVVHDHAIEAYLVLAQGAQASAVEREITIRLAAYKRPRRLHVVEQLPRTATGKLVRDHAVLRDIWPSGSPAPVTPAARADAGLQSVVSNHPLPEGSADRDR